MKHFPFILIMFWQKPVQWETPEQDVYLYGDPVQKDAPGQTPSQVGTAVDSAGFVKEKESKEFIYCTSEVDFFCKVGVSRIVL